MARNSLLTRIQSTSRELMKQLELFSERFSEVGSMLHYHALMEIYSHKTLMNIKELANLLHLEKHTTSRLVAQLTEKGICEVQQNKDDRRFKLISLTQEGIDLVGKINEKSHLQIQQTLALIGRKEQGILAQGLFLYTKILKKVRLKEEVKVRKLLKKDISRMHELAVFAQAACSFKIDQSTTSFLKMNDQEAFTKPTTAKSCYFVLEHNKETIGIAGYGLLPEASSNICVIRCFYVARHARGLGLCVLLMQKLLNHATLDGFKSCYAEDYSSARYLSSLYRKLGFKKLTTIPSYLIQSSTKQWYAKELQS